MPTAQCARARPAALRKMQKGKPLHRRMFSVLGNLRVTSCSLLQTAYCSSACQRADWRAGHRDICSLGDAASAPTPCGSLQLPACTHVEAERPSPAKAAQMWQCRLLPPAAAATWHLHLHLYATHMVHTAALP